MCSRMRYVLLRLSRTCYLLVCVTSECKPSCLSVMWSESPSLKQQPQGLGTRFVAKLFRGILETWHKLKGLDFPPNGARRGLYGGVTTFSVLMYFLILPMCRSHAASLWVSFKGNCSMYSSTWVSTGGGESRNLLSPSLQSR